MSHFVFCGTMLCSYITLHGRCIMQTWRRGQEVLMFNWLVCRTKLRHFQVGDLEAMGQAFCTAALDYNKTQEDQT